MTGYHGAIEDLTKQNSDFRRVLFTGQYSQLVLMTLEPGEGIGLETHHHVDQFFRFESGVGKVIIDDNTYEVKDGDAVIVPAGAQHNVVNTGSVPLKLYTIYSPPNHPDGTVHKTKAEAMADEHDVHPD